MITVIQAEGCGTRPFAARAPFDLVLANILLGPLRQMAGSLARLVRPNGCMILSGLLAAQAGAALAAYRAHGLVLLLAIAEEDAPILRVERADFFDRLFAGDIGCGRGPRFKLP